MKEHYVAAEHDIAKLKCSASFLSLVCAGTLSSTDLVQAAHGIILL